MGPVLIAGALKGLELPPPGNRTDAPEGESEKFEALEGFVIPLLI